MLCSCSAIIIPHPDILVKSVEAVLTDTGFKVGTTDSTGALATATMLLSWAKRKENGPALQHFSKYVTSSLKLCLGRDTLSVRTRKGRMWGQFHQLRTSDSFIREWKDFLSKSVGSEAFPVFFQYVTQKVFKEIVKKEFELSSLHAHSGNSCELTYDDQCAIRYVAGYVCRKVRDKLESSSIIHKNDLILTLYEFKGNGIGAHHASEDWIDTLDRGGLWHATDNVFYFFCCIEEVIRRHFRLSASQYEGLKVKILDDIKCDEDVLFQWCLLTTELDDDLAVKLRDMIIELYVTIRGFAFANSCMELYKQHKKQTLQKSKAIRRTVFESQIT